MVFLFLVFIEKRDLMPASIHEQIGERTVENMDKLAIQLGVKIEDMPAFAAGRSAAGWIFAERDVPEELSEALDTVRENAQTTPFDHHVDTPEFALGTILAAFAIRSRRS